MKVSNPVLKGFNADPAIIYANGVYYIANSTFEWFPGVQIHKSTDLVNWELATRPLDTAKMLDMKGNPKSGGIWAPCLSYDGGKFYLVFTDVKSWSQNPFKDTHNYITTAKDIEGPWSDPVYINSSGFDASLFHDDDGRKWFLNMVWDYRETGDDQFAGILLQEYDEKNQKLMGEIYNIFRGTELKLVEGPHIYKKDGYYYLFTAEGGTVYTHAETVARSENITGPYELHPNKHLITSHGYKGRIQKSGHASMCCGKDGEWYLAHLCGRPVNDSLRCILGRETSIQKLKWENGWPYLANGTMFPDDYIEVSDDIVYREENEIFYDFNDDSYKKDFQSLRIPLDKNVVNTDERKGYLRIYGKESVSSCHEQSLVCRRQDAFIFEAQTRLCFEPETFQHTAGLIYRYNEDNLYYLFASYDEVLNSKTLRIYSLDNKNYTLTSRGGSVRFSGDISLKVAVNYAVGQFWYSLDDKNWIKIGDEFDASILSDEYADPMGFTGAFVGMCCQDGKDKKMHADFEYFKYTGLNPESGCTD